MRMLGLDVGDKRIGVAVCDPLEVLSSALTVIERKEDGSDFETILSLVEKYNAERIIVGLPRLMNGSLGTQAEKTQAFSEQLAGYTSVTIELSDERLSTDVAKQLLQDAGKKPREIKEKKDAAAAAMILQWYLDQRATMKDIEMEN